MSVRIKSGSALAKLRAASNGRKFEDSDSVEVDEVDTGIVSAEEDEDEYEDEDEEYEDEDEEEEEEEEEEDADGFIDDMDYEEDNEEAAVAVPASSNPHSVDSKYVIVEPVIAMVELIAKHSPTIIAALRNSAK